ncbi:MAG: tetratricopeptide repeat protein [Alphaproteobacteria bacterium]
MIPDEIYAGEASASSSKFKYAHPLNHMPVDDGSLRARLAYELMTFMGRDDCGYYINPENTDGYDPQASDDEIDIMIIDGFYKEAETAVKQRLEDNPDDEKAQFQKAFIDCLKDEYRRIIDREDVILATDPKNVNALINKGFALANINEEDAALETLDRALYFDPDNVLALSNKAYIAKMLWRDKDHAIFLKQAYNACAKMHRKQIEQEDARLLRDMDSEFMHIETPSAFDAFNRSSGYDESNTVH